MTHRASLPILAVTLALAATPAHPALAPAGVDLAALRAHLDFLADDRLAGRDTGEPGYEIAALYTATRFRAAGLEPGHGDSFEQRIDFVRSWRESSSLRVAGAGGERELEPTDDFLLRASPLADQVELTAPLAFAGYGIEAPELGHHDYRDLDVSGKIVLLLSGAPASFPNDQRAHYSSSETKAALAEARGAAGLVVVRTRVDEQRVPWQRVTLNADHPALYSRNPDGTLAGTFPELRFLALLSQAGAGKLLAGSGLELDDLLDAAEALDYRPRTLPIELTVRATQRRDEVSSPNVVALLPGADPARAAESVVVTAHLDHVGVGAEVDGDTIYNGFYDNAMGSAILLEVARLLAAGEQPARSVLFLLVTGEEKGLLGSDHFARHPTVPIGSIVANVNVDMPLLRAPVGDLVAFGAEHSSLAALAERAARAHGFTLSPDPMPEEVIFVRSDQYSFVRQGVPAIYLSPGLGTLGGGDAQAAAVAEFIATHYHRPSDEIELGADWDSVARYTAANVELARAIANAPERPSWNPGDFFGETFGHAGDE